DQESEIRSGKHRTQCGGIDLEILNESRRDIAQGLHVESIHHQTRGAQSENSNLRTVDVRVVDKFGNIDPGGTGPGAHEFPFGKRRALLNRPWIVSRSL